MSFSASSSAFSEGGTIPKKFTCDGDDHSPTIHWKHAPGATKSFALIADDPDAPRGTWVHWVVYNIPPTASELHEGVQAVEVLTDGTHQGTTDFHRIGYGGPCPPPGKPHRYYFKVYALDTILKLPKKATKTDLVKGMEGHILAEAQLMGTYGR